MSATDDFKYGFASLTLIGTAAASQTLLTLPAAPGIAWVIDSTELTIGASAPAGQFYDGNFNIWNGIIGSQNVWSAVWRFFAPNPASSSVVDDTIVVPGPVRGTPGNQMTLESILANGFPANQYLRFKATFHAE